MPTIKVTDRDGQSLDVAADNGAPLMEALRDGADLGVQGICGGTCSCGTCHVYIAPSWQATTGERNEDEQMMLEAIADFVEIRPNSRLSCQIEVSDALEGLELEVAPEA